ncbi:MAG: protein kinase [Candidatus Aminicenantes bacterium]|nr:protein kinase [Candidatus Aminicenantes bacterium]
MIGQTISHYKILEKLGEGGMGVVYKAEDTKLDRLVALKFLPKQFNINEAEKKRFIHEAKAAAALDHSNICAVYEIDETEDGQMFIAMAYYEGETLKEKIASRPLPLTEVIDFTIQVAQGLQRAHESHIIHRDIKSANIIVTKRNEVKILDFGLAKLRGVTKLTKEGTTLGTVAYMSPEQASGDKVDHRSDIWSLGVLFYEMVTGQLPFKGDYEQAIMYSIMNEEPEPVTGLRTSVPVDLERTIIKMLVKDTDERYQGIPDLLVDLRKIKRESEPEIKSIKVKPKAKPGVTFSPKILSLAIPFLAAIIIAGYFIFKGKAELELPPIEPGSKPSLAIVYFENKSGDEKLDNWRDAFSELLTIDLSQSKYIRVLRADEIYGIFKKLNLLEAKRYSTQDLIEIAKKGRVNHILRGSYIKDEDNFVITTVLLKADTGETISSLSVKAKKGEIFSNIDGITREIKSKLNLSKEQISSDIDKDIGQITTSSPEAYEYYLEGIRYDLKGDYRKVIEYMEKAVTVDPEFASAYRAMSWAYGNLRYYAEKEKYIKKALELSSRLSDRERFNIQADFYNQTEKTYDKGKEALESLLRLYPEDVSGNNMLGNLYGRIGENARAIEYYEVCKRAGSEDVVIYTNQARSYRRMGRFDKAEEVLRSYIKNISDSAFIRRSLAYTYQCQGAYDLAFEEDNKAISLDPTAWNNHLRRWLIYFYTGKLSKAKEESRRLLEEKEAAASLRGFYFKTALALHQGKFTQAKQTLHQGLEYSEKLGQKRWARDYQNALVQIELRTVNPERALDKLEEHWQSATENEAYAHQRQNLHTKAQVYITLGSLDMAQETADVLKGMIEQQMNKRIMFDYFHLMGLISHEKKEYSQALEYYKRGLSLTPATSNMQFVFSNAMGSTFFEKKDFQNALTQYKRVTQLPMGRHRYADIYAKAFYILGKIYQQQSQKDKAIKNYNKFINLWQDCDPQFQHLVEDARKRVRELESNN